MWSWRLDRHRHATALFCGAARHASAGPPHLREPAVFPPPPTKRFLQIEEAALPAVRSELLAQQTAAAARRDFFSADWTASKENDASRPRKIRSLLTLCVHQIGALCVRCAEQACAVP